MRRLARAVAAFVARWREPLEVLVVFLAVVAVWSPFLTCKRVDNALSDWSYRAEYVGYGLNALLHDHELPFWVTGPRFTQLRMPDAHEFFANPETDVLSLVTPLAAIWGVLTAIKVSVVAHLGLGVWGCRRLLVRLGGGAAGLVPLFLASLLALCNGALVGHILAGHTQFMATAAFPLVLALLLESFDPAMPPRRRHLRASFAGALLALAYYSGAVHPLVFALPGFLVLFPLSTILVYPRSYRTVLTAAATAGVSFVALAAFKLLPGFVDFHGYRVDYYDVYDSWDAFATELVIPWNPVGHGYHHETNLYVGWLGVCVLSFAILAIRDRRLLPFVLVTVALTALMFVKESPHLRALPLVGGEGALRRARLIVIQMAAVLAAIQVRRAWVSERPRSALRWGSLALATGVSALFAVDLARTNALRHESLGAKSEVSTTQGPFDVAPELIPMNDKAARVEVRSALANRFEYEFTTTSPGPTLLRAPKLLTTPHVPHLKLEGDGELVTKNGALAVRVAGPRAKFTLRFYDPVTSWGLAISLLGVAGLVALGVATHRGARRGEKALG